MFSRKFAVIAASALIAGGILTGAAFASTPAAAEKIDQAVANGRITQGAADVMKQVHELRQAAMEKFQADRQAVIDQAVSAGTITQEEADRLLTHQGRHQKGFAARGSARTPLTAEEMKAHLDAKVAAGYMTQEQADLLLSGEGKARFMRGGMKRGGPGFGGFMQQNPAPAN